MAAARRGTWLCLPRHSSPAPALPPPAPRRPPSIGRHRQAGVRSGCSCRDPGCGHRPSTPLARWSPTGSPTPPVTEPGCWLADPPPSGQHRPGHRPQLRRPGRRRAQRRTGHPRTGGHPWPAQLGAAGHPHRRGGWHFYLAPTGLGQRSAGRASACGLAGCAAMWSPHSSRHASGHPYHWAPWAATWTPHPARCPRCCSSTQPRHPATNLAIHYSHRRRPGWIKCPAA